MTSKYIKKKNENLNLMKLAANDPLFLADQEEVNDDFENNEIETMFLDAHLVLAIKKRP